MVYLVRKHKTKIILDNEQETEEKEKEKQLTLQITNTGYIWGKKKKKHEELKTSKKSFFPLKVNNHLRP